MADNVNNDIKDTPMKTSEVDTNLRRVRMGKRLAYILRYAAEKEGLDVLEGGEGSLKYRHN